MKPLLRGLVLALAALAVAGHAHRASAAQPAPAQAAATTPYEQASRRTGNIHPSGPPIAPSPEALEYGRWMFSSLCVRCHGIKGDGQGADWKLTKHDPINWLPRQPRDFTDPVFKLRSTISGEMPVEADLFESISRGLLGDRDMPSFKFLPERDRWALVAYIKSLSPRWEDQPPSGTVAIGQPPRPDAQMLVEGKRMYAKMQCAKCHGPTGKGDGPSAGELKDDSGLEIFPRDFTNPAEFVGPADPRGVYRTFTTGLDGTPMPSFADFLNETERWQLVWYVLSLRTGWTLEQALRELDRDGHERGAQRRP